MKSLVLLLLLMLVLMLGTILLTEPRSTVEVYQGKEVAVVQLEREPAEGLPVSIYPGTRVVEAEILPPRPPGPLPRLNPLPRLEPARPQETTTTPISLVKSQVVTGRISATEERARDDARVQLRHRVTTWLAPDVPASWKPPAPLVDGMVTRTEIVPIEKDYGTLYEATLHVDASPSRRAEFIAAYQHERVARRITIMGGGLAGILVCLAAIAGFIRADEATKGYYTHWLRVAAAAGVGASGVLIYRLLA